MFRARTLRAPSRRLTVCPLFQPSQGDIGEKGPEGAPGKDGARVSGPPSLAALFPLLLKKKNFYVLKRRGLKRLCRCSTCLSYFLLSLSGSHRSPWSSWSFWSQRREGQCGFLINTVAVGLSFCSEVTGPPAPVDAPPFSFTG